MAVTRSMLILLTGLALAVAPGMSAAQEAKPKPQAKQSKPQPKQSAIIIDANTGTVLHDHAGDEPRFPASLTKMMTLYMLFGEIEAGRLSYQSTMKISARANGMAPSKLGLEVGEEISVIEAIKVLVVKSANDIAVAVAEHIGGSEYEFARMMTERARQIGMSRTTFRNASGLPNPSQFSTARDMATLAMRLQDDYPQHFPLFSTTSFTFRGKVFKTHNTLLLGFPGMDGIKTGYTRASGFNLVSSVNANGKRLVGAVFGGKTAKTRNALMRSLLFAALEKASTERTRPASQRLIAVRRPAAKPADATEVAWSAETKAIPPQKTVKEPPQKVAAAKKPSQIPPPLPAVRPARPTIPDVLAQGDAADAPPPQPVRTEPVVAAAPPPRLDLDALRAAMSDPDADPSPTNGGADQPRSYAAAGAAAGPTDIAGLIRNSIVDGVPAETRAAAARPASTLDGQAQALDVAQPAPASDKAPPSYLNGPTGEQKVAALPQGSAFEIQIGAYGSASEAQTKLESVRARAASLLDGRTGVTMPIQKADRQIFRARFVTFDERSATSTCIELRRLAIDCLVMRAE